MPNQQDPEFNQGLHSGILISPVFLYSQGALMKMPICDICLKSGLLCPVCMERVKGGAVREEDIHYLRRMKGISERIKPLQGIRIKKLVNTNSLIFIVCEKGSATTIIGRGGTIVSSLSHALDKRVRVVEETDDIKSFLEMLVFPVPVLSVGRVYRESGETIRMRVPAGERLPLSEGDIKDAAMSMFGQEIEVVTE